MTTHPADDPVGTIRLNPETGKVRIAQALPDHWVPSDGRWITVTDNTAPLTDTEVEGWEVLTAVPCTPGAKRVNLRIVRGDDLDRARRLGAEAEQWRALREELPGLPPYASPAAVITAVRAQQAELEQWRSLREENLGLELSAPADEVTARIRVLIAERFAFKDDLAKVLEQRDEYAQDARGEREYHDKEVRRVHDALPPHTREHHLTRLDTLGNGLSAGHVAESAAALLRWYPEEIQRLKREHRATADAIAESRDAARAEVKHLNQSISTTKAHYQRRCERLTAARDAATSDLRRVFAACREVVTLPMDETLILGPADLAELAAEQLRQARGDLDQAQRGWETAESTWHREQQELKAERDLARRHRAELLIEALGAQLGRHATRKPWREQGPDGAPFWHDEGGNTVRIAPSDDGGISFWVTEWGNESGPRLGHDDALDIAIHLVTLVAQSTDCVTDLTPIVDKATRTTQETSRG